MPRTPPSQWASLFNFAGSGVIHMEHFPMALNCTCYTELLIVDQELVFVGGDIVVIIWPV